MKWYYTALTRTFVFVGYLIGCAAAVASSQDVPNEELTALQNSLKVHARTGVEAMATHLRQELAKPVWKNFLAPQGRVQIRETTAPAKSGGLAVATALWVAGKYLCNALVDTSTMPALLSYVQPTLVTLLALSLGRDAFRWRFPKRTGYDILIFGKGGTSLIIMGCPLEDQ